MPQTSTSRKSSSRPVPSTSPSFLGSLGAFELFNNLLFNRERAYQSERRSLPIKTDVIKEEEHFRPLHIAGHNHVSKQEDVMPPRRSTHTSRLASTEKPASKARKPAIKKTAAKPRPKTKEKDELSVTVNEKRSRPSPSSIKRSSRVQKTTPRPNCAKMTSGRGRGTADAIVSSDGEGQQESSADTPRTVSDEKPTLAPETASTSRTILKISPDRLREIHTRDLNQLYAQLLASQEQVQPTREQVARYTLVSRLQSVATFKALADVQEKLELEQGLSSGLAWECAYLQRELDDAHRNCIGDAQVLKQRDDLKHRFEEQLAANAELRRNLTTQNEETSREAAETRQEIQQLSDRNKALEYQIKRLKDENTALRATVSESTSSRSSTGAPFPSSPSFTSTYSSATSSTWTSSSPPISASSCPSTPSAVSFPQNEGQRLLNLRRMYVSTKKSYDSLHFASRQVVMATKGWDTGSLGELGKYLRVLRGQVADGGDGTKQRDDDEIKRGNLDGGQQEMGPGVAKME